MKKNNKIKSFTIHNDKNKSNIQRVIFKSSITKILKKNYLHNKLEDVFILPQYKNEEKKFIKKSWFINKN